MGSALPHHLHRAKILRAIRTTLMDCVRSYSCQINKLLSKILSCFPGKCRPSNVTPTDLSTMFGLPITLGHDMLCVAGRET